ncbi:efflux RND transporter periplasmic adaptor subunit [Kosakonia quasisacchari]|uniref:Efflux RND transporter periplasmic adaptor subunit n=1 Tax=Kosakonia quasisacchari TaxID=2529380 RepID=A0A4R0GZ11_9ENTR|nr:efflux RND transporter periplasmic adaptor subunit [Kosakonia quasisacchari]TCC01092.1 efflux RND transporter periplasmic adaptor subunit [Kosakonia quasisacchari]
MSEQFTDYFRQSLHHLFNTARALSFLALLPLLVMAAIILLLTGCGEKKTDNAAPPRPVRYQVAAAASANPGTVRTGEIRAHDETVLAFRLDGRIVSRQVDIGARVHAGQVLATLESETGKNQLASATADMESARAAEQLAALNLNRMQKLMPSGAIARTQLDSARADWQSAASRLKSSAAAVRNAQDNLAWTQLTAPADGVITRVSASAGQVVSAGESIFTLATSDARDVVFAIADPQLLPVQSTKSPPFSVALLSDPTQKTTGILRDISPQADPQTRTWQVRVTLQAPPAAMALGASATVNMPVSMSPGFVVPASALSRVGDQPAVFVIDKQSQAQIRTVTLAGYTASSAVIASGISAGDRVITAGVSKLRAGEKVIPGELQP